MSRAVEPANAMHMRTRKYCVPIVDEYTDLQVRFSSSLWRLARATREKETVMLLSKMLQRHVYAVTRPSRWQSFKVCEFVRIALVSVHGSKHQTTSHTKLHRFSAAERDACLVVTKPKAVT
mmetsp:Transcript_10189/g.25251  ORF Transcript_10189/g.25251 Transcript_10189/m.25251 type:complete len:121 (-) Transcript_10189:2064-2426(-)